MYCISVYCSELSLNSESVKALRFSYLDHSRHRQTLIYTRICKGGAEWPQRFSRRFQTAANPKWSFLRVKSILGERLPVTCHLPLAAAASHLHEVFSTAEAFAPPVGS